MEEKSSPEKVPEAGTQANLRDLKLDQHKQNYNAELQHLQRAEGLGLPMKMSIERHIVRLLGSKLMDDVLTGRCDTIDFEDYMKRPKRTKKDVKSLDEWNMF